MATAAAIAPASRSRPLVRAALPGVFLAAGLATLAAVGPPTDLARLGAFCGAFLAAEMLLLDFPDRRGVSAAALPLVLALASGGPAVAVWAAALSTLAAGPLLRRPVGQSLVYFGRAALAAQAAALVVAAVPLGQLGSAEPQPGALAALLGVLAFAGVSELGNLADQAGEAGRPSHVDLLSSVALAPVAVVAWAIQARAGDNALLAVGGGMVALLAVVRSAVNVSTHHADLRRLYDLVERERQKLSTLLAHSGEGVFVVGPDGDVAQVNHQLQRLTGRDEELCLGRPPFDALPIELASGEPFEVALRRVRPGQPLQAEAVLAGADGTARDVLLSYAVVPSPDGGVGGIGIVRDITAMKEAQRERDDFVAVMTHDLRQPLTGLLGYAQLIERGVDPDGPGEKTLRYAQGIRRGGEQMLRMINNLLELSRLEAGDSELELSDVQLRVVVDEVVQSLDAQVAEKKLDLSLDLPRDLPPVHSSETLLRECVANLVGNAVKYTPEGGRVAVSVHAEGGRLTLVVADSGIGIPAEDLPRLFNRFFRTKQAEVRKLRGTGLGLALTKTMIDRLGGTIAVASELGKGTTFTVTLPLEARLRRAA